MNNIERCQKITEILRMFKNGEELYKKSPLFNSAVQMMVEGMDMPEILEQTILACERTQRAFEDYVIRDTRPLSFNRY
jgi:hypothetical protein